MDRVEVLTCSIEDYIGKADSPINKVEFNPKNIVKNRAKDEINCAILT